MGEASLLEPDRDLFRLYALALSLVPDHDVAGDLFMDAPDEAALRQAAARWRRRHGLGEGPEPAALPELDLDQQAHASHLARRGALRRRLRRWAGAAAAVAALTAVALALVLAPGSGVGRSTAGSPRSDPARDPGPFLVHRPALTTQAGGLIFTVLEAVFTSDQTRIRYRVEAEPGQDWRWHQIRLESITRRYQPEAKLVWELSEEGTVLAIFGPMPHDAHAVQVWFDPIEPAPPTPLWAGETGPLQRDGPLVHTQLQLAYGSQHALTPLDWTGVRLAGAYFTGPDESERYPTKVVGMDVDARGQAARWWVEAKVPPSVSPDSLLLWLSGIGITRGASIILQP